jgi:hypothetical protein
MTMRLVTQEAGRETSIVASHHRQRRHQQRTYHEEIQLLIRHLVVFVMVIVTISMMPTTKILLCHAFTVRQAMRVGRTRTTMMLLPSQQTQQQQQQQQQYRHQHWNGNKHDDIGPRSTYRNCRSTHDDGCVRRQVPPSKLLQWKQRVQKWCSRFDTIQSVLQSEKYQNTNEIALPVMMAGIGGLFGPIKKLHNPIVYFVLGILAGFRYDWCFKSPVYWFAIGFTIKWYRARYVFKIPVWDRQPNWNNIITNKEQEKDLRAFTCTSCGSTIFIAKTREFFFEGNTGIGGLGCFSCGAKGKDNFIMDRDRIVEDVGDMDDYFEYERPLDFVSRAERRKLVKEAQGDENRANQLLLERTTGISTTSTSSSSSSSSSSSPTDTADVVSIEVDNSLSTLDDMTPTMGHENENIDVLLPNIISVPLENELDVTVLPEMVRDDSLPNGENASITKRKTTGEVIPTKPSEPKVIESSRTISLISEPKDSSTSSGLDGLDELDMDAW